MIYSAQVSIWDTIRRDSLLCIYEEKNNKNVSLLKMTKFTLWDEDAIDFYYEFNVDHGIDNKQ